MLIVYISNRMDNNNADYSMKGGGKGKPEKNAPTIKHLQSKPIRDRKKREEYQKLIYESERERERERERKRLLSEQRDIEIFHNCNNNFYENIRELNKEYLLFLIDFLNCLNDENSEYLDDENMYFGNQDPRPGLHQAFEFFQLPDGEQHYSITCGDKNRHVLIILHSYTKEISDAIACIVMPPPATGNHEQPHVPSIIRTIKSEIVNFGKNYKNKPRTLMKCIDKVWTSLNRHNFKLGVQSNSQPENVFSENPYGYNIFSYIVDVGIDELTRIAKQIPGKNPLATNLITLLGIIATMPMSSLKLSLFLLCINITLRISFDLAKAAGTSVEFLYNVIKSLLIAFFVMMRYTTNLVLFDGVKHATKYLTEAIQSANIDDDIKTRLNANLTAIDEDPTGYVRLSRNNIIEAATKLDNPKEAMITAIGLAPSEATRQVESPEETNRRKNWWLMSSSSGLRRQGTIGHYPSGLSADAAGGPGPGPGAASGLGDPPPAGPARGTTCMGSHCVTMGGALKTKKSKPKSSKGKSKKHLKIKKSKKSKNSTKKKVQRKKPKKPLSASRRSQ